MSASETLRPVSPTIRITTWSLLALFAIIVIGSILSTTEIVARGQGRIIPVGGVQLVQPQVDGKVVEILATEGQSVEAGDLLIRMDTTLAESEVKRIEAGLERYRQETAVARSIIAALSSGDPAEEGFTDIGVSALHEFEDRFGTAGDGAEALVAAVLTALSDRVAQIDAQRRRISRGEEVQQARIEQAESDREIASRAFASADTLRQQGTISEGEYLTRLREFNLSESTALIALRERDTLTAEADVALRERASIVSTALTTYRQQSSEAEIALQSLEADLEAARAQLANLSIAAPASGRVENLSVLTVGAFVTAGSTLMTVIPSNEALRIEAFFDNRDIGFIEEGQRAFVRFEAFPAERYGIVTARVANVGADARGDVVPDEWVYAVRLELDQDRIRLPEREIRFAVGMTATIDIITGERRLISYFFEPIVRAFQDSLGER